VTLDQSINKDNDTVKLCTLCNVVRPIVEFKKDKYIKSGFSNTCLLCSMVKDVYFKNKILKNKYTFTKFKDYVYKHTELIDQYDKWDRVTRGTRPTIRYTNDDNSDIANLYITTLDKLREELSSVKEKLCTGCNKIKPITEFAKDSSVTSGRRSRCLQCLTNYNRTKDSFITRTYSKQKFRSKVRGHNPPEYTREELKEWMYKNSFNKLYDNWVKHNYNSDYTPSIDRLRNDEGYKFDNIQLVTWKENSDNGHAYCSTKIVVTDKNNVKTIHDSLRKASKTLHLYLGTISKYLKSGETYRGYKFEEYKQNDTIDS